MLLETLRLSIDEQCNNILISIWLTLSTPKVFLRSISRNKFYGHKTLISIIKAEFKNICSFTNTHDLSDLMLNHIDKYKKSEKTSVIT